MYLIVSRIYLESLGVPAYYTSSTLQRGTSLSSVVKVKGKLIGLEPVFPVKTEGLRKRRGSSRQDEGSGRGGPIFILSFSVDGFRVPCPAEEGTL